MSEINQLQEQRNKLADEIKQFADNYNSDNWDSEKETNWSKLNADYDQVTNQITALRRGDAIKQRLEQINARSSDSILPGRDDATPGLQGGRSIGDVACSEEHRTVAMGAWMKHQLGEDLSDDQVEAAKIAGLNLNRKSLKIESSSTDFINSASEVYRSKHPSQIKRSDFLNAPLTTGTPSTGGNVTAPESMLRELEINMLAFSGIAQVADLMVTQSGEDFSWPTVDDTANTGEQVSENASVDNSGSGGSLPSFGKVTWGAHKLSSEAILVPYELLEDNVVNLPQVLGQLMGERIGRLRNERYTNGTGSGQATGLVTASALGVTAASATVIDPDELIDLQHSVDPAYRMGAGFMMHDSIVKVVRKLKDSAGDYIWESGIAAGQPDSLLGSPLTINQSMDSTVATGNKTVLFGQFSKYKIRRVNGFRLYRLEEKYRDNDQDGFVLLVREDGNLLQSGTAPVKYLQQA